MEFKFFNYIFPNDLESFKQYLTSNMIEFKIKDYQIFFHFENQYCKKLIEASATFDGDKITRLELKCNPISFNNRKKIEGELDSKYKLIERDLHTLRRIYEAEEYSIIVNNPETLWIDVQFEPVDESKEEKLQLKRTILFTVLGVILSTICIILYLSFKSNIFLNLLTAIIAVSYAMYQFIFLYIRKALMSRGSKIALCIIIPFLYILIMTFVTVIFFARAGALTEPDIFFNVIDVLMVFIYLSPSFHLIILLIEGMSYA